MKHTAQGSSMMMLQPKLLLRELQHVGVSQNFGLGYGRQLQNPCMKQGRLGAASIGRVFRRDRPGMRSARARVQYPLRWGPRSPVSGRTAGSTMLVTHLKPTFATKLCCRLCRLLTALCCAQPPALEQATGSGPCRSAPTPQCGPKYSRWRSADASACP